MHTSQRPDLWLQPSSGPHTQPLSPSRIWPTLLTSDSGAHMAHVPGLWLSAHLPHVYCFVTGDCELLIVLFAMQQSLFLHHLGRHCHWLRTLPCEVHVVAGIPQLPHIKRSCTQATVTPQNEVQDLECQVPHGHSQPRHTWASPCYHCLGMQVYWHQDCCPKSDGEMTSFKEQSFGSYLFFRENWKCNIETSQSEILQEFTSLTSEW